MISLKKVVKGAGYYSIGRIVLLLLGFVITTILARLLGSANWGYLALGLSFILTLEIVLTFGLSFSLTYFIPKAIVRKKKGQANYLMKSVLLFRVTAALIVGIVLFLLSDMIAGYYDINILSPLLKILAIGLVPYAMVTTFGAIYQANQKFQFHMYQDVVYGLSRFSPIILFLLGFGLLGVALGISLAYLIAAIVSLFLFWRFILFKEKSKKHPFKPLFKYAARIYLSDILLIFSTYIVLLILGFFGSQVPEEIAYYSIALVVGNIVSIIPISMSVSFLPTISQLKEKKRIKDLNAILNKVVKYSVILVIPSAFGIAVLSKSILNIVFGADFLPGFLTTAIVAIGYSAFTIRNVYDFLTRGIGEVKTLNMALFVQALFTLFLAFILIPRLLSIGAGLTFLLTQVLGIVLIFIAMQRHIKFGFDWNSFGKVLLCGLIMAGIMMTIQSIAPFDYDFIVLILLGILIYTALLFVVRIFDKEDKELIKLFLNKIKLRSIAKLIG
jgi:O-antigen/teichoic acid export membrane protein